MPGGKKEICSLNVCSDAKVSLVLVSDGLFLCGEGETAYAGLPKRLLINPCHVSYR